MAMPGLEVAVTPVINLARAYRRLGRLEDARLQAERAVGLARAQGLIDNELRALIELAVVHEQLGRLEAADTTITEVVDRLEAYRAELAPQDFLKQGFGDSFADAYGIAVRVRMQSGEPGDALTAAERMRSRAFADVLASRRQRDSEVADVERGVWNLGATAAPAPQLAERADSRQAVPALDSVALAALAARLDTTLVAYWIHEEGSYAWVVQPTGAIHTAKLLMKPAEVQRAVARVADTSPDVEIASTSTTTASAVAADRSAYRSAYQKFWAPIDAWLPAGEDARITVIPHGPLFALPFGALLDAHGRYVVERYSLHYAASGAVLAEAAEAGAAPRGGSGTLVIADPPLGAADRGVRLPPLSAARAEARAIARLQPHATQRLVGLQATESAVRAAIGGVAVAHFATHAVVSASDPLGSYLLLAPDPGRGLASSRDGRLTAVEITELSLRADLVVLGACRSARGRVSSDGIAGLTRAFMAAGAPTVVATLWDVSDQATARVMTRFYAAYLAGLSTDRALRSAQLALLRDLRAGRVQRTVGGTVLTYAEHPHLWAGTVLIGVPSRP
jgi:CHAT domain-containing protein